MRKIALFAVIFTLLAAPLTWACIWDRDTLAMEKERFPDVHELISGKFVRHSKAFYQWRIENTEKRLAEDPGNLELVDDLAVAYEKIGNTKKAIALMEESLTKDPKRYRTLANLGTFYIHDGQFERGNTLIAKAIDINPDAHFGREKYQHRLVEYVTSKQVDGKLTLPVQHSEEKPKYGSVGFARFLIEKSNTPDARFLDPDEVKAAIKGVTGMMHFGNYDHPVLLEALGDLLSSGRESSDANRLAARAYLKASYETDDEKAIALYRNYASSCLRVQMPNEREHRGMELSEIEDVLKKEIAEADAFFAEIAGSEQAWIEQGADVEAEFAKKYFPGAGEKK
jgi:tetratricopeptide (TPR) repeat protein